ncbi:hypothetical protein IWQ62_002738 [Dispira parvispora]|uniref:Uncharacterized protein n=1 Tax=Dispira parvispora TaxID=1520584 RepID=A0A9W8APV4_9FUNG|nr:hypothetical protein IWQ62_002738 [Dispira parvispora]
MSPALSKKSTKGKGDTAKTPKLKGKAKPKATSASPKVSTSILEFSPVMVASKAPTVTSPLITSTTVGSPSMTKPETQPAMTNLKNQAKMQEKRHAVSLAQQQMESLQKRQDSLRQTAAAQKTSAETNQTAALLQLLFKQGLIKPGQPIPPEIASRLPPAFLTTVQAAMGLHAKANASTPTSSVPLSSSPAAAMTSPPVSQGIRLSGNGPNGVQTPSSSVQSATSSQEAISTIHSPANRLAVPNTPISQPALGAYSQGMSNAMYMHYMNNMAGNQNPASMAQLNTLTHSPAMTVTSTPAQQALYVNAQTMSPNNPALLPRTNSQNSGTGEALSATTTIWMGKLMWEAKDRAAGAKFTHSCLVSANPGSHEIRRSMRNVLRLPATPAESAASSATSPFNLMDFQLPQWPKDLQTRQLMSVDFDKMLRYIVEKHCPFVEFSPLPNQEDAAASNNYRSLLSNLGMKPMAAFIPFTNTQEAASPTQTPGMFLIFHTKLIGVLSLANRIPYEVIRAPNARPDEGQANATQMVSPLNANVSPQVLLQSQNQLLAAQPQVRPPSSVAFSNTLTAANHSQTGNAGKMANNNDLTAMWMNNMSSQKRSEFLQQLRQATQNSTGNMNPSPQVQMAQFMAQQSQQQQQQLAKNLVMGGLPGNAKTAGGPTPRPAMNNPVMSAGASGANNSPLTTQALQQMLMQTAARAGRPMDPAQVAALINNNAAGNPGTTPTSLAANANPMLNKQRMNVGNVALLNSLNNNPGNPAGGNPLLAAQGNSLGNASMGMNPTNMMAASNLRPGSAALNSMLLLQQNRQQMLANMAANNPALNAVGPNNNNPNLATVNPGLNAANMRNMALPSGNFSLPNGPANGGQMLNQQLLMQLMQQRQQQQQQQQSNQQRNQLRPPGKF